MILISLNGFAQAYYSNSSRLRIEILLQPGNFIYVDDDNTAGPWTGTDTNPFENIPEGLAAATSGSTVVVNPGNYFISQDISVPANVSLFLSLGDTVRFTTNTNLNIMGSLQAFGTINDSIYFTSSNPAGTWDGLRFLNSQQNSELRYCSITNAVGTNGNKGGGIYMSNSAVKIFGCRFQNNMANFGAAIYCDSNSSLEMDNCEISGNNASISGGGIYGFSTDSLLISHCFFNNNIAIANGGAIALKNLKTNMLQNEFFNNAANNGGAIHFENVMTDTAMFSWNRLKSNTALLNGGGLYINNSSLVNTSRNLFLDNSSVQGGAVYFINSMAEFYNNTLYSNTATGTGGGIYSASGNNNAFQNIIWKNSSSDGSQIAGTGIVAMYNNVENGYTGTDNISNYPLFVDTANHNFYLQYSSPCINSGNPAKKPDPDSTIADMGMCFLYNHLPVITQQPVDITVNVGNSGLIDLKADWASHYQWQFSSNDGVSWSDISDSLTYSGFTTPVLQISDAQENMDGYKYRCMVFSAGTIPVLSDEVVLIVHPVIYTGVNNASLCTGNILVPVNVTNCNSVGAISLTLLFDGALLTYNGYQNPNSELNSGALLVNSFNNKVIISWVSITPANIGNNMLLELMFSATAGLSNLVWDTITPGKCEYSDEKGNIFLANYGNGSVNSTPCTTQLGLKVYMEGSFNGVSMNTGLNHLLPLSQPFNSSPWNYSGTENVLKIPNGNIVDWGLVELRETTGNASTANGSTVIARQAVFILSNGKITGLDGSNLPSFTQTINNNLFVVLRQRNHLSIMSANALIQTSGIFTYDYSTGQSQVYGGIAGHKEIGTGVWGMMAGDGNADGTVDINDKNNPWTVQAATNGYLTGDFDLNAKVDNKDKNDEWIPNTGNSTQVPN